MDNKKIIMILNIILELSTPSDSSFILFETTTTEKTNYDQQEARPAK